MACAPESSRGPELVGSGATSRLAEQLHTLAAVSEALTYRLLELEERLQAHEESRTAPGSAQSVAAEDQAALLTTRLGETEDRLGRIEALLRGLEPVRGPEQAGSGLHLQALRPLTPARRTGGSADPGGDEAGDEAEDPFYEEGEQPFMDERTA